MAFTSSLCTYPYNIGALIAEHTAAWAGHQYADVRVPKKNKSKRRKRGGSGESGSWGQTGVCLYMCCMPEVGRVDCKELRNTCCSALPGVSGGHDCLLCWCHSVIHNICDGDQYESTASWLRRSKGVGTDSTKCCHGKAGRLHSMSDKPCNIASFTVLCMHAGDLHESDTV